MDMEIAIRVDSSELDEAIKKLEKLNKLENNELVKVSLERVD